MSSTFYFVTKRVVRSYALASLLYAAMPMWSFAQVPGVPQIQKGNMMMQAKGDFTVKLEPQTDSNSDAGMARMTIDKKFSGDLEATSRGQMLSAGTETKGSAGYVAMEKVTGTLAGRTGSFVLQHSATMNRGTPQLSITVVPDSGTGELVGLSGTMNIIIANGKHSYEFDYTIKP